VGIFPGTDDLLILIIGSAIWLYVGIYQKQDLYKSWVIYNIKF